jgi:hypothetical protein
MLLHHGGLLNVTRNQAVAKDRPHREATIMDAKMARIKIKARDNHKVSVKVKDSRAGMVALKTQVVKALAEVVKDDRMALTLREEAVAKLRRLHNLRIKSWMACWGGPTGCFCIVHILTFLSHFFETGVHRYSGMVAQRSESPFHLASQSSQASDVALGRFLCTHMMIACLPPAQESPAELHLGSLVSYNNPCSFRLSLVGRHCDKPKKFASKGS